MKNRLGVIILAVACVGLGIALVLVNHRALEQQKTDTDAILGYSNKWVETTGELDQQQQKSAMLAKDLDTQHKVLGELTNQFTQVTADLSQTKADLSKTETSLKASQEDLAKRDAKISELESQNQALDKQAIDLSASITNLTLQIADTQRKLSASEGDKAFLQKELKRLMAEKAELERQFNDLAVLRSQVAKLKEELNISRRLEWIRQGLFANSDQKGAQKLMQGFTGPAGAAKTPRPAYDLNVEVRSDGSVKVIPPPSTNAPPAP